MLAGQTRRHGVCSPVLDCCGAHEDLIPDLAQHRRDHAEAGPPPERAELGESLKGLNP
jgi:hypothetical protein